MTSAQPIKSELPVWAKLLLGLFIAGTILFVAVCAYGVYFLGNLSRTMTDPRNIARAASAIAEFRQPLPAHFKFSAGVKIPGSASVIIIHEPDNQIATFIKIPTTNRSAQELLNAQQAGPGSSTPLDVAFKGKETVGGEQMPYLVGNLRQTHTDASSSGQELIGIITPPGKNYAVLLTVLSSGQMNMGEVKELLSAIKGFKDAGINNTPAQPSNSAHHLP